jgi:hypothetical protein
MSFLGLSLLAWTAIAAIGTLLLAAAATVTIVVTLRMARADRKRDDAKRQEDRQWDSARRKEDRDYDAAVRKEDRERDDQLRREAAVESERRFRAEQRDREDFEARQVTVEIEPGKPPYESLGHDLNHRISVSTPTPYPLKHVEVQIVHWTGGGNLGILPIGHAGDPAVTEHGRIWHRFWADIPDGLYRPVPIVRFTDRNGNLYYSFRHQTWRLSQTADFITAAQQIDQWVRMGPKPDETGA